MEAEKMFNEIGYEKFKVNELEMTYDEFCFQEKLTYYLENGCLIFVKGFKAIIFLVEKGFEIYEFIDNLEVYQNFYTEIDFLELQAIVQQTKELGWV